MKQKVQAQKFKSNLSSTYLPSNFTSQLQIDTQFNSINATCVLGIDKLNLNDNTKITSSSPTLEYKSQTFCRASQINGPSDLNRDALIYDVMIKFYL